MQRHLLLLGLLALSGCGGSVEPSEKKETRIHTLALSGFSEWERQAFDEAASRVTKQTNWSFSVRLVGEEETHDVLAVIRDEPEEAFVRFDRSTHRISVNNHDLYLSGGSYADLVLWIESALYAWREGES